jgi:hypothetical protein
MASDEAAADEYDQARMAHVHAVADLA